MVEEAEALRHHMSPQEASERPGNSEELEAGVVPLKPPQDNIKTRDDRQHVNLTLPSPGLAGRERVWSCEAIQCTDSLMTDDQHAAVYSTATDKHFETERSLCVTSNTFQREAEEFQQAKHRLEELFQKFSSLLGLVILVVCLDAPEESLKHLEGVEQGTDIMEDAFKWLGYATLRLSTNATGRQLRAMIRAASEAEYPDSYTRIFFHFIGHGVEGAVYTKDDYVPLSDIVQPFHRIPHIPKVFIFDCCRQFANSLSSFTTKNTFIIYPTNPGRDAYASAVVGPLMTEKLAFLFRSEKTSINDIVTKLSNELREFQVCSATSLQLSQPISLLEEQESAMRPTNVQLQNGNLSWDLPALGDYFILVNFTAVWKEASDSEAWKCLDNVDPHQKHFSINTSQFSSASGRYVYVAVQANYQGKCVTSKECRLNLRRGKSLDCHCSKCWWIGFGVPLGLLILLLLASIVGISVGTHIGSFSNKVLGYNGDTVECDRLSPVYSSAIQVSECGDYNGYHVGVYKAEGELKTYKWIMRMSDTNQSAIVGRFGIPINVDRVPYLFEGSTITMSICLQSMNITTAPVGLFIFDDLDKRNRFIERKSDSKTSVQQWQLPVGSQGRVHCSNVTYDVQYGGYYCLALDSPSNVVFKENLTENVISVNTSEYQVDCTVAESDPCIINIFFGLSPLVRILCHIPEYDPYAPTPPSTYLCYSRQPRSKLYIASGILAFLILIVTLVALCFSRKRRRRQREYQHLS